MVPEIKTQEQYNAALEASASALVLIDFFAKWCAPCSRIAPQVENLSMEYSNVSFYKLDVDGFSNVTVPEELGVQALPTIVFFRNGTKVTEVVGANTSGLEAAIKKNL